MTRATSTIREQLTRHRPHLVHAARMTAASLVALTLAYALGLSEGLWAVITAIVVTQSSVGGSLSTAFEQFAGSLFGAAYAVIVVLAIAPADPLSNAVALAAALAVPSIMAALSPGFRIVPITAAIILLGHAGLQVGPLGMAASRITEVGIGCGVGLLVAVFVVPARASRSIPDIAARLADLLAGQLDALASGSGAGQAQLGSLAVRTRESLNQLEKLVDDAARERRIWLSDVPDGMPVLRTIRRLRHDIDMLRRTSREAGQDILPESAAASWVRAAETGAAALRRTGQVFSGLPATEDHAAVAQAVRAYRAALEDMRRGGVMRSLSTATLGRLFGIGFALDQFRRDLDDLIERSEEFSASRARSRTRR